MSICLQLKKEEQNMSLFATTSRLKEMRTYKSTNKRGDIFNEVSKLFFVTEHDLNIISYVLDLKNIGANEDSEKYIIKTYIQYLTSAQKFNYQVNMDFWA